MMELLGSTPNVQRTALHGTGLLSNAEASRKSLQQSVEKKDYASTDVDNG
jgi:hypothetical protein